MDEHQATGTSQDGGFKTHAGAEWGLLENHEA